VITKATYEDIAANYKGRDIVSAIPAKLVPLWCDEYYFTNPRAELVQVDVTESATSFNYIFDIKLERTVVAFGIPIFNQHKRDSGRMAGHPLSAGAEFHRGHLMAHSIGGGTDINLVPQLGKLNIGAFRVLERMVRDLAQENVRSLYFVRPIYANQTQTPKSFEQCVILSSKAIHYSLHNNL